MHAVHACANPAPCGLRIAPLPAGRSSLVGVCTPFAAPKPVIGPLRRAVADVVPGLWLQVSVIAFLEASDMPVLGMPGTEGVRLLTGCKRAFTDAILGAMNQILTKPCVRE